MINYNTIPFFKPLQAGSFFHNLPTRFMPGNFVLVSLGPLPDVLTVNGPDIAPANGRRLGFDQDLTMPGLRNGKLSKFHGAVSGKHGSRHHFAHCRLPLLGLVQAAMVFGTRPLLKPA
jgi:hypothetical protein